MGLIKIQCLRSKQNKWLGSESGQISIFIALIFQVLFVFFAMVINVGLLVHHKINLQNSVDLGAYYAASRQAEVLNAIAHQNYQIRQAWKLLSWRYRVLGSVGFADHPSDPYGSGDDSDTLWTKSHFFDQPTGVPPLVCVTHTPMWNRGARVGRQNPCRKFFQSGAFRIVLPAAPRSIFRTIGDTHNLTLNLNARVTEQCQQMGIDNWMMAARIFHDYKNDQANRKSIIYALADDLGRRREDFTDLDGNSVAEGVRKTISKNLTDPSRDDFNQSSRLQVLNGFAVAGGCEGRNWLSEIRVEPTLAYVDSECTNSGVLGANIRYFDKHVHELPTEIGFLSSLDQALLLDLHSQVSTEPRTPGSPNYLLHSSLGVEKNPWCMAYVGVKAQVTPKIPFSPLGDITLEARAFAKPFGGRIGPWYMSMWPSGSDQSNGEEIDKLLPPRVVGNGGSSVDPRRWPNYSRFPGDTLGVSSRAVLSQYGSQIKGIKIRYQMLGPLIVDVNDVSSSAGDVLSSSEWGTLTDDDKIEANKLRNFEIAAISPDIFDITYYSIDANYSGNYLIRFGDNIHSSSGENQTPRGDIGSRLPNLFVNVSQQINVLNGLFNSSSLDKDKLYHKITSKDNLLTSWTQLTPKDYSLKSELFGKCLSPSPSSPFPTGQPPNPGDCISGGRTGYSVKLVAKEYLESKDLPLGGGPNKGPIKNPPPPNF